MLRTLTALAIFSLAALPEAGADTQAVRAIKSSVERANSAESSQRGTTPDACKALCEADRRCTSWTLTEPTFRIGPRCQLTMSARLEPATSATPVRPARPEPMANSAARSPEQLRPTQPVAEPAPPVSPTKAVSPDALQTPAPQASVAAAAPEESVRPTASSQSQIAAPSRSNARPALSAQNVPAPPPMIARRQPKPASTTPPAPQPAAHSPAPATNSVAPGSVSNEGLKPLPGAPRVSTGADERPPLPRRRLQQTPSYSVQSLERLPGDYDATAGYVDPTSEAQGDEDALDGASDEN